MACSLRPESVTAAGPKHILTMAPRRPPQHLQAIHWGSRYGRVVCCLLLHSVTLSIDVENWSHKFGDLGGNVEAGERCASCLPKSGGDLISRALR